MESLEQLQRQTQAAAYQTNFGGGQGIQVKPEIDARLAPMDNANIFAVKEWNQQDESSDDDDDNIQDGPVHKLPRGRGRRRRYILISPFKFFYFFLHYHLMIFFGKDMSKLKMVGSASNADWLCQRENTCEVIMKSAWVVEKYCPMYPKIWSLWVAKKEALKGKPKKKELLLMQRKLNMKMKTFSNALVASMFIGMYSANIYHF